MSWARVGMKVVCVSGPVLEHPEYVTQPSVGEVYTIRAIGDYDGIPGLLLCEIRNPLDPFWGEEFAFYIGRFRPLVSNRTQAEDVALFRKFLDAKSPEPVQ